MKSAEITISKQRAAVSDFEVDQRISIRSRDNAIGHGRQETLKPNLSDQYHSYRGVSLFKHFIYIEFVGRGFDIYVPVGTPLKRIKRQLLVESRY
jgi:hypothetical protein